MTIINLHNLYFFIISSAGIIFLLKIKKLNLRLDLVFDNFFIFRKFISFLLVYFGCCFFFESFFNDYFLISYTLLVYYFIPIFRKISFELFLYILYNSKKKFFFIKSINFFFANYLGLKYFKYYLKLLKYFKYFNNLVFPVLLLCYNSYYIILCYIILSIIFDINDLNQDFNQALLGYHYDMPIFLTVRGKLKLDKYYRFLINNYLFFFPKLDIENRLVLDLDFHYINKSSYEDY